MYKISKLIVIINGKYQDLSHVFEGETWDSYDEVHEVLKATSNIEYYLFTLKKID